MRGDLKMSLALCIPQVAHEASAGEGGVHLEARGKERISQGNPGASDRRGRFRYARTEIMQQAQEFVLLVGLRRIIGRPILRVGWLLDRFRDGDGLRHGRTAVGMLLPLHGEFDGEEMLAFQPPCFMVRTGTMG